jgi:predicted ATPase
MVASGGERVRQEIGRYRIVRPLGRGGAGEVYEAVLYGPGGLRRPVALKILREGGEALRREARIGGLLRHRHLVDVYEIGEDGGTWFCAMELCAGGRLSDRRPLPPRAVVEVGLQVCEALQYAHEELGLVHLDLKPDNLLLGDGAIKVADLGISRARGFAGDGRVRGTPGFMAPEQARGAELDCRADVYALGATLADLAGHRIGAGTTMGWDDSSDGSTVDFDDAPTAGAHVVPDWLAPVLERCLADDPGDRWPDMASLAAALRSLAPDGAGLAEVVEASGGWGSATASAAEVEARGEFVGRAAELDRLAAALEAPGLLIVKGPAGIGKSRLVSEAVHARRGRAVRCDLSAATTFEGVLAAIARALDLSLAPRGGATQLGHALAAQGRVVLFLDDVEPIPELAGALAGWRRDAPEATLVVASRSAVRADGEAILEVGPLSDADSVALLVARARHRGADIADDPQLTELAARLDGVPLALELAAGRLGVLSVGDLVERLGLSLLRSGADHRHGTLRAALEASWGTLSPAEQAALAQLSVFAGGFELEDAEEVLDVGGSGLAAIAALEERSLVSHDESGRLRLLASVREFAAEHLVDAGPAVVRHGRRMARLGTARALDAVHVTGGAERLRAIGREADNLVAACRRALARADGEVAVCCLCAAWAVMGLRGPFDTISMLAVAVAEMPGLTDAQRSSACTVAGRALRAVGRLGDARPFHEAALEATRAAGDRWTEGSVLANLGLLAADDGRLEEAKALDEEALAVLRAAGHRRFEGVVIGNLGILNAVRGDLDAAGRCFAEALAIHREVGDVRSEGFALSNLGNLARLTGDLDEAVSRLREAEALHRQVGDRRSEGIALTNLTAALRLLGRTEEARAASEGALRAFRVTGQLPAQASALIEHAALEPAQAPELLARAEAIARSVGDGALVARVLCAIAEREPDPDVAEARLRDAEAMLPPGHAQGAAEIARVRAAIAP